LDCIWLKEDDPMTDRQFLWGLSNGVFALAIAGTFWIGYGFGPSLGGGGWIVPAAFTVGVYGAFAAIVWLAVRLKRRVDFKRSELKQANDRQRAETHKIMVGFFYTALTQAVLIAVAVFQCLRLGQDDLIGPSIALIVSLHFIPLGRIFHVRTYYFVGITGAAISLVAFSPVFGVERLMFLGGTMGMLLWLSAIYMLWRADRISKQATSEEWAV
jgi:hypothetical protein